RIACLSASPRRSLFGVRHRSDATGRGHVDGSADLRLDFGSQFRMLAQEFARVVLALADLLAVVCVPRAGLLDDAVRDTQLDDFAFARNAFAVQDIEQRFAEWRRDLVLDDLDARFVADDFLAPLDRTDAADVESHRRVELERTATGGGLGIAEHHADLHADL